MKQKEKLTENSVKQADSESSKDLDIVKDTDTSAEVSTDINPNGAAVRKKPKIFNVGNITVMAVLTAISYILYRFVRFPLPFIFPSFLDIQFSDMPALLGGFALGPVAGCIIIIIKCCLKMFETSTACVGEFGDILVGIAFVLPASIIYKKYKSKRSAWIGLLIGGASATIIAVIANRFLLIPFYAKAYGMDAIMEMVSALYPNATEDNFYNYYLPLAVVPFNILRCLICGLITFFVYKPLSKALHWEGKEKDLDNEVADTDTAVVADSEVVSSEVATTDSKKQSGNKA